MATRKQITDFFRWVLKLLLYLVGFVITIMPFVPAFKEYFMDAPEKDFGAKEVLISVFGVLIFTGGYFSNKMVDAFQNAIIKRANK